MRTIWLIPEGAWIEGGGLYREERPTVNISVDAPGSTSAPVTNAEFAKFVADTGYVTVAERSPELGGRSSTKHPDHPARFVGVGSNTGACASRRLAPMVALDRGADWHQPQEPGEQPGRLGPPPSSPRRDRGCHCLRRVNQQAAPDERWSRGSMLPAVASMVQVYAWATSSRREGLPSGASGSGTSPTTTAPVCVDEDLTCEIVPSERVRPVQRHGERLAEMSS